MKFLIFAIVLIDKGFPFTTGCGRANVIKISFGLVAFSAIKFYIFIHLIQLWHRTPS